jgi:hypothetical protein
MGFIRVRELGLGLEWNATSSHVADVVVDGVTIGISAGNELEVIGTGTLQAVDPAGAIDYTGGTDLACQVDGSTIDISAGNELEVMALGVDTAQLAAKAVTFAKTEGITNLYNLGAPVLADVDRIFLSAAMHDGAYAAAAQPDVPRNITLKRTVVGAADTPGTITITGTDYADAVISEAIVPGATGVTVAGLRAFKTISAIVGAGWVASAPGDEDTVEIGVGTVLGLPAIPPATANVVMGILGIVIQAITVVVHADLSKCTIDMSAGTYDGSKKAYAFVSG